MLRTLLVMLAATINLKSIQSSNKQSKMLRKLFTFFSMVTILNTILVDAQSVAKMPVTKKQVVAKKRGNHHSMLAPNHSRAIAGDEPHQEPVQQHPQVTMPHSTNKCSA